MESKSSWGGILYVSLVYTLAVRTESTMTILFDNVFQLTLSSWFCWPKFWFNKIIVLECSTLFEVFQIIHNSFFMFFCSIKIPFGFVFTSWRQNVDYLRSNWSKFSQSRLHFARHLLLSLTAEQSRFCLKDK